MMTTTMHIAGQTDVGRSRQDNQDTFISQPLWSLHDALLVVIDGVGGYAGGAEAAALARESIVQYMAKPTGDTLTMLREAVVHANNQIVRQRQQNPSLGRMCCVLTAAVADASTSRLLYVHVGDTRLYRLRHGQLDKLTHDHSLVGVREDANQLTEREAMHHPRRNEILRDIGSVPHRIDDPDFLESNETDFAPGDALLLCSDGLTDMLTRAQITDVLTQSLPAGDQIKELIRQANEAGGQDNITVVLAQRPTHTSVPEEAHHHQAQTSDPPLPTLMASLHNQRAQQLSQRTWMGWGIVLGVAMVLLALLFIPRRPPKPLEPASPAQAVPADSGARTKGIRPLDSSGINNAPPTPDSLRATH